jgi:pilus assembly protein FimV
LIEKSHKWHKTAIAAAALTLLGLSATEVSALSLGRVTVLSALGEPLRAEIDVPNITAEEAASLKANAANPAAFAAAGLEYNAAMPGLQANLMRRADGRAFIRLSSDRAINDPFVDLILEASWSAGRIVRDYTMLFDPASLKPAAATPTLPQTTAPAQASVPARVSPAPAGNANPDSAAPASKPATVAAPVAIAKAPVVAAAPSGNAQQVIVKPGDSASKLALRNKASDVSLDQMLVAMLRSNPDAFTKGNLNRLRAGAVMDLPSADQAKLVPAAEASQTVIAQSKDFNAFRRGLADNAPKVAVEAPDRKATGAVEAKVDDKKASSNAADKLTLSKGALQAKADEAKIAKDRADKDSAARAAELAKNIADLTKLSAASSPKAAATPAPAAVASQPASAPLAPKVEVAAPAAPAPASSAAALPAKSTASAAAHVPEPEVDLVDQLMENPTLPLVGGGLLALLGGFALYRRQQSKKRAAHVDSSFLESRLQPDSFFGASGGQRVDTAQDGNGDVSSLSYTNSQLGSADDVDPVAEADVYLAYGRDVQAEEILKEAVRQTPGRLAIHSKLLDVYAKRRDTENFQASANAAFKLVGADNPEWARICELGLSIDPENTLYQPGGATPSAFGNLSPSMDTLALGSDSTIPVSALAELPASQDTEGASDLDLDLDFSAEEEAAASAAAPLGEFDSQQTVKMEAVDTAPIGQLDFDISEPAPLEHTSSLTAELPDEFSTQFDFPQELPNLAMGDLDFSPPSEPMAMQDPHEAAVPAEFEHTGLSRGEFEPTGRAIGEFEPTGHATGEFEPTGSSAPEFELDEDAEPEAPAHAKDGMLEFDLGSLSLDLDPNFSRAASLDPDPEGDGSAFGEDSLETKLALAEEFVSIGDQDGARALIEEVVAESTGELRDKAQRALAKLS